MSRSVIFTSPDEVERLAWENPGTPVVRHSRGSLHVVLAGVEFIALEPTLAGGAS